MPEADWRVLPNAVDLERYRPDPDERTRLRESLGLDGELVVGTACALRPGKQLEQLFQVVARLAHRDVPLLLAGGPLVGGEAYASGLLELGRRQLAERLVHLGHLDDLRSFLNGLDLFINTSEGEAGSIGILEALASGCPVVGYPSISVQEQVLPEGGEIVPQDDVGELAAAVDRWLDDPGRLATGRLGARRRVETDYDPSSVADQLWSDYHDLLER